LACSQYAQRLPQYYST